MLNYEVGNGGFSMSRGGTSDSKIWPTVYLVKMCSCTHFRRLVLRSSSLCIAVSIVVVVRLLMDGRADININDMDLLTYSLTLSLLD